MQTSASAVPGEQRVPLKRRVLAAGTWSMAGCAVNLETTS
jgi:hypothetical protein